MIQWHEVNMGQQGLKGKKQRVKGNQKHKY